MIVRVVILLLLVPTISGCLKTRSDVGQSHDNQVVEQRLNVETVDSLKANYSIKINELELELRRLNGKLEELEHKLSGGGMGNNELIKQNRILISSIVELKSRLNALEGGQGRQVQETNSPLSGAEELFRQKKWSEAIIEYEKYRSATNKKDDRWAQATYKIGLCFQNMNLHREAESFYKEVIDHSPNSPVAVMAKKQLQTL